MRTKDTHSILLMLCAATALLSASLLVAQTPAGTPAAPVDAIDAILLAHGAGPIAPVSVEMRGTAERNGKTEPFRLLATRDEELKIQYGTTGKETRVLSAKASFRDDGEKTVFDTTGGTFAALDATGLFFVQQLRHRAVRVAANGGSGPTAGAGTLLIRVESERTRTLHQGKPEADRVELSVNGDGRLAGVSRRFHEGRPEQYTQIFTFSDYRKTDGVWLPYRIEVAVNGRTQQKLRIESYAFDIRSDRNAFQPQRRTR